MADRLQDCEDTLFHQLQFGSVKGRSATDVLYKAVKTARKVLDGGGSVGWGFWDVKGGYQIVVGEEVLRSVSVVEECRRWCKWLGAFLGPREFEVSWDGMVRGAEWTDKGAPSGLSPISDSVSGLDGTDTERDGEEGSGGGSSGDGRLPLVGG